MRPRAVRLAFLIIVFVLPGLFVLLAQKILREFEGLHPGDMVPVARLWSADRLPVDTSSWRGNPTLLVVFQPGCDACRREIGILAVLAPSFPAVKIVLLSTTKEASGIQAPFPVYVDRDGTFLKRVRKLLTPTVYWIDGTGRIRYARAGQHGARAEEVLFRRLTGKERQ